MRNSFAVCYSINAVESRGCQPPFLVTAIEPGGASFGSPVFIPVAMTAGETGRQSPKTYDKDIAMTSIERSHVKFLGILIAVAALFFAAGKPITEAEAKVIAEEQFELLWGRTYVRNEFNDPELNLVTGCGGHPCYRYTWNHKRENLKIVIQFRRKYKSGADATWLDRIDVNKPRPPLRT